MREISGSLQFKRTASKRAELDGGGVRLFDPVGRDGRKQAMFVGGKANGGGGGGNGSGSGRGKLGGQVVVDSFIPKYDRRKEASELYFSNADASRAFFNDQYQNPNFLKNIKNEKLQRERKRKELQLKRSLGCVKGGEVLRGSTLASSETRRKMKAVSQTAFNASALDKIGFNPTKRMFETKVDGSGGGGGGGGLDAGRAMSSRNSEILKMLNKERSKSHKLLGSSKKDLVEKKRKWDSTMKHMEEYSSPKKKKKKEESGSGSKPREVELDDSSSEDEFEDKFGGKFSEDESIQKFLAFKKSKKSKESKESGSSS
ncbi:unnamed protein product [Ambrosiozyma monospora]|uniref:Unnamed protein product n=1 Tax=Ambrosiozyma monospora TaxID=43982 RepID=A0A9W7DKN2_AMBMO|nr:unnamed protein product [Ambrosiozyma monospora]